MLSEGADVPIVRSTHQSFSTLTITGHDPLQHVNKLRPLRWRHSIIRLPGDGSRNAVRLARPDPHTCQRQRPKRNGKEFGRRGTQVSGVANWSCYSCTLGGPAAKDSHWPCGWKLGRSATTRPTPPSSLTPALQRHPLCTSCCPGNTHNSSIFTIYHCSTRLQKQNSHVKQCRGNSRTIMGLAVTLLGSSTGRVRIQHFPYSRKCWIFGRPLGPGLCHRKSVCPSVRL